METAFFILAIFTVLILNLNSEYFKHEYHLYKDMYEIRKSTSVMQAETIKILEGRIGILEEKIKKQEEEKGEN